MRCTDDAAGTEDADAGGKTNVAENGQVIGTARFLILFLKISKRISDRHCGFEKKCIQYICRFFSGFRRNYKDGGFNRENDISFT